MLEIKFEAENRRAVCYDTDAVADSGAKIAGKCTYEENDGIWTVNHTLVEKEYGGQGLAKKLLECVVAAARSHGAKIVPTCSFVVKEFNAHPDLYADLKP